LVGLELFLDEFEGVAGLLSLGLAGFMVGCGDFAVFGGYGDFGVEA
jgi:hypothetical protein